MSQTIDRGKEALSFINGNKFGIETFSVIHNFGLNVDRIISTLEVYGNLFDELNGNNLLSKSNPGHVTGIKQQIVLDAIMKTQIIIESTLVLIHSLSIGYNEVAMNMTYYHFDLVDSIIEEIGRNKKLKNCKYNLRKAIGLPNLKYLELSFDEKKFLNEDFKRFEVDCLRRLKKMTNFYDKFRVIYGKSKHGLVFVPADTSAPEQIDFDGSLLQCFGRISNEDKRPKSSIVLSNFSTSPPVNYKFFDFVSILKFDNKLIDEINSTLLDLKWLVSLITTNHLAYALNCGKRYLPYNKRDGKRYMLTSRAAQTENEKNIIKRIAKKNLDKFYLPRVEHIVTNNYNNPKIVESLNNERITNVVLPKDTKTSNSKASS